MPSLLYFFNFRLKSCIVEQFGTCLRILFVAERSAIDVNAIIVRFREAVKIQNIVDSPLHRIQVFLLLVNPNTNTILLS